MAERSDESVLEELRRRESYASGEWKPIRDEANIDMRYVAGDPWDPKDRQKRKDAGRPCLSSDELSQYHNQTINDLRANPRGMKFSPTGREASEKGAEFYQNKAREVEYRSSAQVAYITAAENMIQRSYGWVRITTKFESDRSFNQDIWIEPVMNPDNVLPDPDSVWPDSRDIGYLFYIEGRLKDEFKAEFPGAKIQDFTSDHASVAPRWFKGDKIQLAEYWTKEIKKRRLLLIGAAGNSQAETVFADELKAGMPPGYTMLRERDVDDVTVMQYLTNGVEILKKTKWLGKHIPFVSWFGKVLYVDLGGGAKRQILSMTRLARDPQMLYCYMTTCEAEVVGAVPRNAWRGYEGQFSHPEQWQKASHEPVAYLESKVTVEGAPPGTVLPLPQRESWDPPLQNIEIAKEAARRAIQAAMGISPLPTTAQRHNEKSGAALRQIESSGQRGSFHFSDHHDGGINRVGVIFEDLCDKVYDSAREVGIRKPDDSAASVWINNPQDPESVSTKGDYQVTVSVGPGDASQQQAATDFVDVMVGNLPAIAEIAGPRAAATILAKSIKLKRLGTIGDEIVEAIEPPSQPGPDGKPLPPEVQRLVAENQQLKQQLGQAAEAIKGKQFEKQAELEGQATVKKMELDAQFAREVKLQEMKNAATISVAHIAAAAKGLSLQAHAEEEMLATGLDIAQQTTENAKDRLHEITKAQLGHQHMLEAGQQSQDQALEQGEQGQQFALEQQASQPDMATE